MKGLENGQLRLDYDTAMLNNTLPTSLVISKVARLCLTNLGILKAISLKPNDLVLINVFKFR